MRRQERERTQLSDIRAILDRCQVLRLGMVDGAKPYIVPLNFGYTEKNGQFVFYFHCATEGRKIDILRKNSAVCLELDCDHKLLDAPVACRHSYRYQSVIADGTARELADPREKTDAMVCIMRCLTGKEFPITPEQVAGVSLWAVTAEHLRAKVHMT